MIPKEYLKNLCKTTYNVSWYESDLDVIRSYIAALPTVPTEGEMVYWIGQAFDKALKTTVADLSSECKAKFATPITTEMKILFAETIVIDLLIEYFKNECSFRDLKIRPADVPAPPGPLGVAPDPPWADLFVGRAAPPVPRRVVRRAPVPQALHIPRFDQAPARFELGAEAINRMREAIAQVEDANILAQLENVLPPAPPEDHD